MPHVRYHIDASSAHYCNARILCLVNIVDTYGFVHQLRAVVIHISGYESSQIESWLCLREGFILDYLIGNVGRGTMHGNEFRWCRLSHFF